TQENAYWTTAFALLAISPEEMMHAGRAAIARGIEAGSPVDVLGAVAHQSVELHRHVRLSYQRGRPRPYGNAAPR
ncbi:MAG: hypothetical protein ACKPKO_09320, partial [Candidatus Fonsibacter sp.]